MFFPDLKQLFKILTWHQTKSDNKHVGIFLPLPEAISEQFPPKPDDESPPHITVLYVGEMNPHFEEALREAVGSVCKKMKPFAAKLSGPKKFLNREGQSIKHSPITSQKLQRFNKALKIELYKNFVPFDNKYPEYKPHVTIEYINEGEKSKSRGLRPKGKWVVDHCWIFGTQEPYLIPFGK